MAVTFPELGRAGRLGNQLFQIASTVGIARELGTKPLFPEWDYAPIFSLPKDFFEKSPGPEVEATNYAIRLDERERIYLQDVSLFDHIKGEIKAIFSPSEMALDILSSDIETIRSLAHPILSLHVRRGDILTHPEYHPVRSVEYYERALTQIEFASVVVFSDDLDWCRKVLAPRLGLDVSFYGSEMTRSPIPDQYAIDGPVDWQDLFLMQECDSHIISNSTYAWWGAYLSEDSHPIYPSNWFGHMLTHAQPELLFPENWIQVLDETQGGV